MNRMEIKSLILKVQRNEKVRWEEEFPSVYGEKEYTANNKRNTNLAIKQLQNVSLTKIRDIASEMGLMYFISQNEHTGRWGLDKIDNIEGGGIIAQASTYNDCISHAYMIGIHPIFIYGVGVDGW